jgi:hypothetical protein
MPGTPVIPNRNIVLSPLEAYLGIVVLCHKVEEIGQDDIRFIPRQPFDALREAPVDVDLFPSRDG